MSIRILLVWNIALTLLLLVALFSISQLLNAIEGNAEVLIEQTALIEGNRTAITRNAEAVKYNTEVFNQLKSLYSR